MPPMNVRTIPTDADGVEDRFPGRESPTTVYNRLRCPICGVVWNEHQLASPDCAGRRPEPAPTLFDVGPERKGAYSL